MKKKKAKQSVSVTVGNPYKNKSLCEVLLSTETKPEAMLKCLEDGVLSTEDFYRIDAFPHPLLKSLKVNTNEVSSISYFSQLPDATSYSGAHFYDVSRGFEGCKVKFSTGYTDNDKIESIASHYRSYLAREYFMVYLVNNGFHPLQKLNEVETDESLANPSESRNFIKEVNLLSISMNSVMPSLLTEILNGLSVDEMDEVFTSKFMWENVKRACQESDISILQVLNKFNYDFYQLNEFGESFLFYVNHNSVLEFLLNEGLDVQLKNKEGLIATQFWNRWNQSDQVPLMQETLSKYLPAEETINTLNRLIEKPGQELLSFKLLEDWVNLRDNDHVLFAEKIVDSIVSKKLQNDVKDCELYYKDVRQILILFANKMEASTFNENQETFGFREKYLRLVELVDVYRKNLAPISNVLERRKLPTEAKKVDPVQMLQWLMKTSDPTRNLDQYFGVRGHSGIPDFNAQWGLVKNKAKNASYDFFSRFSNKEMNDLMIFCNKLDTNRRAIGREIQKTLCLTAMNHILSNNEDDEKKKTLLLFVQNYLVDAAKRNVFRDEKSLDIKQSWKDYIHQKLNTDIFETGGCDYLLAYKYIEYASSNKDHAINPVFWKEMLNSLTKIENNQLKDLVLNAEKELNLHETLKKSSRIEANLKIDRF